MSKEISSCKHKNVYLKEFRETRMFPVESLFMIATYEHRDFLKTYCADCGILLKKVELKDDVKGN